jgi:hypothetical protein
MTESAEIDALVKDAISVPLCHDLLRFLYTHSYTRFNRPALVHLFGLTKARVMEEALDRLVALGLVEGNIQSGLAVFWLTRAEPIRKRLGAWFEKGERTDVSLPRQLPLNQPIFF